MVEFKAIVIRKSPIHSKGVFANRDFVKGEIVIDWSTCSTPLTREEVEMLPSSQKKYVSYQGGDTWVLFRTPGKYVNHSCEANTMAINGADVAARNIAKGEEVTADYVAEKVLISRMKCNCGTKSCVGIIGEFIEF